MTNNTISIAITGSGGAGVMTAGQILLKAVAKTGYYGLMARSLGPQIRGGEAAALLRFSSEKVENQGDFFNILIAFDWGNISRFQGELPLRPETIVIYDPEGEEVPEFVLKNKPQLFPVPLAEIAKSIEFGRANMVGLGFLSEIIGLNKTFISDVLQKSLKKKGEKAFAAAIDCFDKGVEQAKKSKIALDFHIISKKTGNRWSITGNEAAGLGAVRGGIKFVAAYPITPATDILEWLAPNINKVGGVMVQAEDELAAIAMLIGASFGGKPSLTATSGPGFALMIEALGLGIASEIPMVIVDVQRGGPSTGIPTKSEQSDLNIALYGAHGDAPHLVLAANSPSDCLFTTEWATILSENTQCPAIVLSDQFMGQALVIVDEPSVCKSPAKRITAKNSDKEYLRYKNTESGISEMSLPGTIGREYIADGLEHNEKGLPSTEANVHQEQLDKRLRKLTSYDYGDSWADVEGHGETAIITFGSITGSIREALKASDKQKDFRLISIRLLYPIQPEKMAKALDGVKRAIIIEQNHMAQLYHFLKGHYDLPSKTRNFARTGPLPIKPEEITQIINGKGW
ncbi:MAG: 2-oxoacid:acceptor oxidoreductase subunit alpha [Alphaproteobacteria bacterium]